LENNIPCAFELEELIDHPEQVEEEWSKAESDHDGRVAA
jgi:hypothetical protein